MAIFEVIDRGSAANDGTGDPVRYWALKTNNNFAKAANIEESNTFQAANTHSGNDVFNGDNTFNGADTHEGDEIYNGNNTHNGSETFTSFLSLGDRTDSTISAGVITITSSNVRVASEGAAADDLDTIDITDIPDGTLLILGRGGSFSITVTENGNINLGATTRVLNPLSDKLTLILRGTTWDEISYSDND